MNAQSKVKMPTGLDLLRQPFPDHQISKLPKESRKQADERKAGNNIEWNCKICGGMHHKNAVHLDYVGHAALTDRLLDADPNWSWAPYAINERGLPALDPTGGLWINLTVCGVTRLGYGSADGKSGGDAIKEIIGDALRNAAMRFGAALDLWHKGDLHLGLDGEAGGHSRQDAVNPPPADGPITNEQMVKLQSLIKATGTDIGALMLHLKAPENARLVDMPQHVFPQAVEVLEQRLADMAKAETATKAKTDFGEVLDDEITF